MKQDFRSYALVKALALLLAAACVVGAAFSWVYCGYHWDSLFDEEDYSASALWSQAANDKYGQLMETLNTYDRVRRGETLGYLEQKDYDIRLANLDPSVTNFRYIIRDNATGEVLLSSSGEDSLADVEATYSHVRIMTPGSVYYNYRRYDEAADITIFYNDEGAIIGQVAGHTTNLYAEGKTYRYAIEYGVDRRLPVDDEFRAARNSFRKGDIRILYLACGLTLAALAGWVFLMCCAGRRRGEVDFTLNWSDKIPYDLYLFILGAAVCVAFPLGLEAIIRSYWHILDEGNWVLYNVMGASLLTGAALLTEAALMSTASRVKNHSLLKNTVIWRLCVWTWRAVSSLARALSGFAGGLDVTFRVIFGFAGYLLVNAFLAWGLFRSWEPGLYLLLLAGLNTVALGVICRWTLQWSKVRAGTEAIVGGYPDTVIDTTQMKWFPSLRTHAEQLGDLGSAVNTAVEERLKSERMKAELITNVSHDLKTPLTSIINYVDLLKKMDIGDETAREYIEVLDRKSQRLKKLTEDLVEASKASTGSLSVTRERLGMAQLVNQALGEYTERFQAAGLVPVVGLPEQEVWVWADGRHVWRILDNLMGNCLKYALSGTRVYLDLMAWDGYVTLSVKNVSAQQLNIPPDQLMERFVRGDESRTTEGSGLGLSIARSLCELQGGTFRLEVDGDLFKAVVSLPQVE